MIDSFVWLLIIIIGLVYLGLILLVYIAQFVKPYEHEHNEVPTIIDFPECEQAED